MQLYLFRFDTNLDCTHLFWRAREGCKQNSGLEANGEGERARWTAMGQANDAHFAANGMK